MARPVLYQTVALVTLNLSETQQRREKVQKLLLQEEVEQAL